MCLPSGCFETTAVQKIPPSLAMNRLLKQYRSSIALGVQYKLKTSQHIYRLLLQGNFNSPKNAGVKEQHRIKI